MLFNITYGPQKIPSVTRNSASSATTPQNTITADDVNFWPMVSSQNGNGFGTKIKVKKPLPGNLTGKIRQRSIMNEGCQINLKSSSAKLPNLFLCISITQFPQTKCSISRKIVMIVMKFEPMMEICFASAKDSRNGQC